MRSLRRCRLLAFTAAWKPAAVPLHVLLAAAIVVSLRASCADEADGAGWQAAI